MKNLLLPFFLLAFCLPAFAQDASALDKAVKLARGTSRDFDIPILSGLTRGVVGQNGKLSLSTDTDGMLLFRNSANTFYFKLDLPTPSAVRTVSWPIGGGTLVTTPTTLTWQFTGTSFNTVLTQTQPTVGSTVITLPDTADVDVSLPVSTLTTNGIGVANSIWFASNATIYEGATADAFETTISAVDPTADQTLSYPNFGVSGAFMLSSLTTNTIDAANSIWFTSNGSVWEGATADGSETTFTVTDPTADRTITWPDATGTPILSSGIPSAAGAIWGGASSFIAEGATADTSETTVAFTDPTADRTVTIPDATGTVSLAQASTAVSLTADNQAVTPGSTTVIQLSSDDATATNRTFTLSATGAITGATYRFIGPATNQCEIAATGIQKLSATWSPTTSDTLTLLFDGTNFLELSRSNN